MSRGKKTGVSDEALALGRDLGMSDESIERAVRLSQLSEEQMSQVKKLMSEDGDEDFRLDEFLDATLGRGRKRGERGMAKATLSLLDACQRIIEAVQPITVRGVCYRLFVKKLIPSMEQRNTAKISRLLTRAREKEIIPWEWIVDDSRQVEKEPSWLDIKAYGEVVKRSYRRDFWQYQDCKPIVMSEKATVAGILRPVLGDYGVPFIALHGFNSATKVHELAEDSGDDERKHVFLYVGDHDPSGMHMSEKDLPERLRQYGAGDFEFRRVALTDDDLDGLPPFDAKKADPRFGWYAAKYGDSAWELDAMDPNALRQRVAEAITKYVDAESWQRCKRVEAAEKESIKAVAERMVSAQMQE